jgi:hypothetical protein
MIDVGLWASVASDRNESKSNAAFNKALHDEEGAPSCLATLSSGGLVSSLTIVSSVGSPSRVNAGRSTDTILQRRMTPKASSSFQTLSQLHTLRERHTV